MLELWQGWWLLPIHIGCVCFLLWVVLVTPAFIYRINTQDKNKIGRIERLLAKLPIVPRRKGAAALPQITNIGRHWNELNHQLETTVTQLYRAQTILFRPALVLGIVIFLLGILQMVLAFLGFIGQIVSWQYLAFAAMLFSTIPAAITLQLEAIRWRNRVSVEGQFLEKTSWVVYWLRADLEKNPDRLTTGKAAQRLDSIERLLRTRYRRPNVDTPLGEKVQNYQWLETVVPLLRDKIKFNELRDPEAVVLAITAWINEAAGLLDQSWSLKRSTRRHLGRKNLSDTELTELYNSKRYDPFARSVLWLLCIGSAIMLALFYILRVVEHPVTQSDLGNIAALLPGVLTALLATISGIVTVRKELRAGRFVNPR